MSLPRPMILPVAVEGEGGLGQERLFDERVEPDPRRDLMQRVAAFVAPVAADAGSVTDDPVSLDVADAMYQAFGDLDADGGLTRGELLTVCADLCDEATFNNRFNSFEQLGMLQPVRDKAHQVRYVFNPTSAAALLCSSGSLRQAAYRSS